MSKYTDFIKANYSKVKKLPNKERFKELGKMWAEHKKKMVKDDKPKKEKKEVKKEKKLKKPKKVKKVEKKKD